MHFVITDPTHTQSTAHSFIWVVTMKANIIFAIETTVNGSNIINHFQTHFSIQWIAKNAQHISIQRYIYDGGKSVNTCTCAPRCLAVKIFCQTNRFGTSQVHVRYSEICSKFSVKSAKFKSIFPRGWGVNCDVFCGGASEKKRVCSICRHHIDA